MSEERTGRKIYEIEALIGKLKDESWFAVSHNSVTKRVSALGIAEYLNGDDDKSPSSTKYYSSVKITQLFENTGGQVNDLIKEIENMKARITQISQTITEITNSFNDQIRVINQTLDAHNIRISKNESSIAVLTQQIQMIDQRITTIIQNIDNLQTDVSGGTKIITGSVAPVQEEVPEGTVYVQYL